jgi:hypothetical protein
LPKKEFRSPRRIGGDLREKMREVEPHRRGSRMLSRGGSQMISKVADMLMPTPFLVLEVKEEAEEESSHVSHVGRTDIKPLTAQIGKGIEEILTSLRRRGMTLKMKTLEAGSH